MDCAAVHDWDTETLKFLHSGFFRLPLWTTNLSSFSSLYFSILNPELDVWLVGEQMPNWNIRDDGVRAMVEDHKADAS